MKTSTRRRFGWALLGVAIIGAVVLQYAGFGFRGVQHQSTPNVEWTGISFHWALLIAGAFAAAGFLCLIIPGQSDDQSLTPRCLTLAPANRRHACRLSARAIVLRSVASAVVTVGGGR